MKYLSKIILSALLISTLVVACKKEGALPNYTTGNAPVISSSKATVAATPADSSTTVLTLSWTSPMYANDATTTKYVLEIDSAGRNFSKAVSYTLTGTRTKSFTGAELNAILLGLGFNFNVAYSVNARVTSSYANNNDLKVSNTATFMATAYKVPPKIALPINSKLYIVGGATVGGWNNPVPTPTQEFARIDETTYMGVFDFVGNDEFLLLPVNGDWSSKFAVVDNTVPGIQAGGDFQFYTSGGANFKGPSTAGKYLVTIDFQRGKFSIVPFTGPDLPTDLFIVGNATAGGWNNPVPVPSQQLTRLNSCVWQAASLPITGGNEYLLLPVNGSWSNKYSVANKSLAGLSAGGTFGYNLNDNFPAPATSGNYTIDVNFATAKFSVHQ